MEPILPTPINLEGQTAPPNVQPVAAQASVELAPNTAPEQPREVSSSPAGASIPVQIPPVQPIPSAVPSQVATQPLPAASDDPQIADDIDVIEKEWVDKAKKIVNATKEDPHMQEKEVSKLQANYLMKRYNKQLKLSE